MVPVLEDLVLSRERQMYAGNVKKGQLMHKMTHPYLQWAAAGKETNLGFREGSVEETMAMVRHEDEWKD